MKYVIIGNSAAGIGTVEGIREYDKTGEIVMITDEVHHTYSRPLISYLLLGKTDEERMKYRPNDFYEKNNVELISGVKVTAIDDKKKSLTLDNGEECTYDKLMVSTGSSAFVPPMDGLDSVKNKTTFMSLDDAHTLRDMITPNCNVLIIGAGLIGLKCAEGIMKTTKVTCVDLAPKVLSSILDDEGAAMVQANLEAHGAKFILGDSVELFKGNKATLKSGKVVDFDVLVLAVGVRPNVSLLGDIAKINRGISVNERSETTAPDIYAAGDCTETFDISSGENRIMALLPNAYLQGECAGRNMAGGDGAFDNAIPMNAIGFFGVHVLTAGNYTGESYIEKHGNHYKRLFYSDGRLNGFIIIGDIDKAGIYTSLIREKRSLDAVDFEMICKKPGMMAFTKQERLERLSNYVKN